MQYQLDDRLLAFSASIWKPIDVTTDARMSSPSISEGGIVLVRDAPIEGPETDNERFFTMIWNCAKPSRWLKRKDMTTKIVVTSDGKLVGDIGYDFEFTTEPDMANGTTKFVAAWGIE